MTGAAGHGDVVVIGGGLAGITAAIDLATAGRAVTLIEGRPWLGGATCSFTRRGLTIDNGQHAFLRCCTAYRELLGRLGVTGLCSIQDRLDLTVLADTRLADRGQPAASQARWRRSNLPSPLHLARSLAGYRLLPVRDRAKVAAAAMALCATNVAAGHGGSFGGWLTDHRQHKRAREVLWDWLCVAALNVPPDNADLALAARAIRTAVLTGRDKADIGVPSVPFSSLHGAPAAALLGRLGVTIRVGARVVAVQPGSGGGYLVTVLDGGGWDATRADELGGAGGPAPPGGPAGGAGRSFPLGGPAGGAGGSSPLGGTVADIRAAGVVLAVPPEEAAALAPPGLAADAARWQLLRPSPVLSIHVTYGSQVTTLPFAAVVGSPVRWVIDKTAAAGLQSGQYLAASVPAAAGYVDVPTSRLRQTMLPVLGRLFPAAAEANVEDFFVTRERRATVRHAPGTRRLRPAPGAGPPGLAVAGAWTDPGWPDTMEGAVRSGRTAALKVIADLTGRGRVALEEPGKSAAARAAAPSWAAR